MKKIKTLKDELENAGWKIEEDIETPVDFEGFFLTLIRSSEVGLAMNIYLRCVENKDKTRWFCDSNKFPRVPL